MKTLISWIGWADFKKIKIDDQRFRYEISDTSPNMDIHKKSGLSFDQHILLSNAVEDENDIDYQNAIKLFSQLSNQNRRINIKIRFIKISDAYSLEEISPIVESVLDTYRNDEIYILFSMGTSIMSIAWFNLYERKPYRIKMIFGRDPTRLKPGKLQFEEVRTKILAPGIQNIIQGQHSVGPHVKITPTLAPVYNKAKKAAQYDNISILILGESGTGKEELAKFIQQNSVRYDKEFISVNCASISDNLLESRLFGYVKGAFTDAKETRKGIFEEASGGIVFLDEIGDISPKMQQSLLRVLQEEKIQKVGSSKEVQVDIRILAATNKNLLEEVKKGNFREDLYYRLNDVSFTLPSLIQYAFEDRKELVNHFIAYFSEEFHKTLKFDKESLGVLYNYSYPGNIRQLQSILKNIYVFNEVSVNKNNLPEEIIHQKDYKNPILLEEVKKKHIRKIYKLYGQKKPAARALGINLNTLKKYIDL